MSVQESRPDVQVEAAVNEDLQSAPFGNDSHRTPGQPGPATASSGSAADETEARAVREHLQELAGDPTPEIRSQLAEMANGHDNQARVAIVFAAANLNRFIYVHGLGWHYWKKSHWAIDKGDQRAQNAVLATLRTLKHKAADDRDGAQVRELIGMEKASGVKGILQLAASQPGISVDVEQLDADPYLFNCRNGVLDLHTLELRKHDPRDLITKVAGADYVPGHHDALWDDFLTQVLPRVSVREYFQRLGGLTLIGKVIEHIFPIAIGTGRNGKGVAYGAIMNALGDYGVTGAPGLFEQVKTDPNAPSPAFANLRGARFVVISEMEEGTRLSASVLKRLSGGDKLTARLLRKDPIEFEPSHTSLMVCNHLPGLPANDPAVWARVRVIPFEVVIPKEDQDPHLPEKLELAASAVLTWLVDGLAAYLSMGMTEPPEVMTATDEYAAEQDDVLQFIEAECDTASADGDTTTALLQRYEMWADTEGIPRGLWLGRKRFGEALDRLGFPAVKTSKGKVRKGLSWIIPTAPGDDEELQKRIAAAVSPRPDDPSGPIVFEG